MLILSIRVIYWHVGHMPSIVELPQKMVRITLQMRMTCARDIWDRFFKIKCLNLASINKRSNSPTGIESAPILRKRQAPAADRVSNDTEIIKNALMRKMISARFRDTYSVFTLNRPRTSRQWSLVMYTHLEQNIPFSLSLILCKVQLLFLINSFCFAILS